MKKRYLAHTIICFTLLSLMSIIQAQPSQSCHSVIPQIQKKGVLTVGAVNTSLSKHMPLPMKQKDKLIMQGIAKALNVKLKLDNSYHSFNSVINAVAKHKVDIGISFLSVTNSRLTIVNFSLPYITLKQDIVIAMKEWKKINNKQDLSNLLNKRTIRIAIEQGSSYEKLSAGLFPKAQLIPFKTWGDIANALEANQVDASVMDDLEYHLFFLSKKNPNLFFEQVSLGGFFKDHIAVAIPKTSCDLTHFINQYLIKHHLVASKIMTFDIPKKS